MSFEKKHFYTPCVGLSVCMRSSQYAASAVSIENNIFPKGNMKLKLYKLAEEIYISRLKLQRWSFEFFISYFTYSIYLVFGVWLGQGRLFVLLWQFSSMVFLCWISPLIIYVLEDKGETLNSLYNLHFYNIEFSIQLTFLQHWILYSTNISTTLNSLYNLHFYNTEFSIQFAFLQPWILYTICISTTLNSLYNLHFYLTITWSWTKVYHSRQEPTVYSVFYEDDIHTSNTRCLFPIRVNLF